MQRVATPQTILNKGEMIVSKESPPGKTDVPKGKLTFWQKGFWSMGAMGDNVMANSHGYLAMQIYNVALGVNPAFLGLAMGIPRLIDAITDPIMGNISDNMHSRFGRRRPFIFIGAILSGLMFYFMWAPPKFLSSTGLGWYFLMVAILYYLAYTVFTVPWGALGLELTQDYNERTKVQAFRQFMAGISGFALGGMWWLSTKIGNNEVEGVRVVGIIFGLVILVSMLTPAIMSRENIATQKQPKIPFGKSLMATLKNGPFIKLCIVTLLLFLGIFLVNPFALYMNINYVFGPKNDAVVVENIEELKTAIDGQGADKIIDAVWTYNAAEVLRAESLQRINAVAGQMSLDASAIEDPGITPQSLKDIKDEINADTLKVTLMGIVSGKLTGLDTFKDADGLAVAIESACMQNLEPIIGLIESGVTRGTSLVEKIDSADAAGLAAIEAATPSKDLESVMRTASYVLSKSAVSIFNFWGNFVFQGALLLSLPVVAWVSSKIGKKRTMLIGLGFVGFGFSSSWFLYTPTMPYLQMACLASIGVGLSAIFMLGGSIMADICDIDELSTGRRREGMFGAMYAWVCKAGQAGTLILSGFMLNWSGYNSSILFRFQPEETITMMRQMYTVVPGITAVVAFFVLLSMPVSEKRMHEVRALLDARKEAG